MSSQCQNCQQLQKDLDNSTIRYQSLLMDYTCVKNKQNAMHYQHSNFHHQNIQLFSELNSLRAIHLQLETINTSLNHKLPPEQQEFLARPATFYSNHRRQTNTIDHLERLLTEKNIEIQRLIQQRNAKDQQIKMMYSEMEGRSILQKNQEIKRLRESNRHLQNEMVQQRSIRITNFQKNRPLMKRVFETEHIQSKDRKQVSFINEKGTNDVYPSTDHESYEKKNQNNRLSQTEMFIHPSEYLEGRSYEDRLNRTQNKEIYYGSSRSKSRERQNYVKRKITELSAENQILRKRMAKKV